MGRHNFFMLILQFYHSSDKFYISDPSYHEYITDLCIFVCRQTKLTSTQKVMFLFLKLELFKILLDTLDHWFYFYSILLRLFTGRNFMVSCSKRSLSLNFFNFYVLHLQKITFGSGHPALSTFSGPFSLRIERWS